MGTNCGPIPCYGFVSVLLQKILSESSRKHAYIILTPLNPYIYTVKLRFTGLCITFFYFVKNINCGYSLEPLRYRLTKAVLFSICLNRCFFVMKIKKKSKTVYAPSSFHLLFLGDSPVAVVLFSCVAGFLCGVCFVIVFFVSSPSFGASCLQ